MKGVKVMSKTINNLNKSLEDILDLSNYAEIEHGTHLNLGTDSNSAFRGDYGQVAYNHSQATHAPSNAQKNSDITKAEIEAKLTGGITSHTHNYASSSDIGTLSNLQTSNKSNLVGAINELFQNVDSGKQLIADAIDDDTITKDSTFEAMSDKIIDIKNKSTDADDLIKGKQELQDLMKDNGFTLTGNESISDLVTLLENNGLKLCDIKHISAYHDFTYIVKKDDSLWSCGYNESSQLGFNDTTTRASFTKVTTNISNDVEKAVCCYGYGYVIKKDGSLWGCGSNQNGRLGLGSTSTQKTFKQITTGVRDVAGGAYHSLMVKTDGSLWVTGYNNYGQLGIGASTSTTKKSFTSTGITDVKKIDVGWGTSYVLKNDGVLLAAGYNAYGQLGTGGTSNITSFTQIATNVKDVIAGRYNFVFIIKNDGTVWSTGQNTDGQLGLGDNSQRKSFTQVTTNVSNVKKITCGYSCTIMLKNDGTLWGTGDGVYGQLGLGTDVDKNVFTQATTNITQGVKDVVTGGYHNLIIRQDNLVMSCGQNTSGQLGIGSKTNQLRYVETSSLK
jgi:alpha-tubulin suppressor-like RCC1 family protein